MSSLFDDLKEGLEEAIAYEKGTGKANKKTYMILPVTEYSNNEICDIRMKARMTQSVFAAYMGVSPKTVEALVEERIQQVRHVGYFIFWHQEKMWNI